MFPSDSKSLLPLISRFVLQRVEPGVESGGGIERGCRAQVWDGSGDRSSQGEGLRRHGNLSPERLRNCDSGHHICGPLSDQMQLPGPGNSLRTAGDAELAVQVIDVGFDRAQRYHQLICDLLV